MRLIAVAALSLGLLGCGDGDDGIDSLVDVSSEPAGSNCDVGGVVIKTGFDGNGNGVLDADEVDNTSYVCEEAPVDNPASLSSLAPETAGDNCQYGGVAVSTGIDDDLDGILDAEEIDETTYVCNGSGPGAVNPVLEGDVTITSALEATMLTRFSEVTGNLSFADVGLFNLDLHNLIAVGGNLDISDPTLETLDVSALASVGGLSVNAPLLTNIDFPSLTIVDEAGGNGHLNISTGALETTLNFPLLTEVYRFNVSGDGLTTLNIPELATVGENFWVDDADALVTLSAPKLTTIAGNFRSERNDVLTTYDFAALVTISGNFRVRQNDALTTLDFPVLVTIAGSEFRVDNNDALACTEVNDLINQITTMGDSNPDNSPNGGGTCPNP